MKFLKTTQNYTELEGREIRGVLYKARTNAEFLKSAFGWSGKQWYRTIYPYSENCIVWMVRFSESKNNDWKNVFDGENEEIVREYYTGKTGIWNGKPIQRPDADYRIVVSIEELNGNRYYEMKGLYKYNEEESKANMRIYNRVSNYLP